MSVVLAREGRDRAIDVTPSGDGFIVTVDGKEHRVEGAFGGQMRVRIDDRPIEASVRRQGLDLVVEIRGRTYLYRPRDPRAPKLARRNVADQARGELHAPMPGLVVDVMVAEGDAVDAGQAVVVVEAMKMQNALTAPLSGRVSVVRVTAGATVDSGALLLTIQPEEG
ncbi:MAG TPA: biotin/lipoyl-containing protein [Candidatus Eisenbacteria bacterium]|nr:biotin/lipoyl-containing protein [Candidatus Eisenbacteria bacterium]